MLPRSIFDVAGIACTLLTAGYTDSDKANLDSYGSKATVTCYSGGVSIYNDESSGKVSIGEGECGVYNKSSKTDYFVHTYADCIVERE
jgi:hypothetical protein